MSTYDDFSTFLLRETATPLSPLISHTVDPNEGFDTHHFNVEHEGNPFDVMVSALPNMLDYRVLFQIMP